MMVIYTCIKLKIGESCLGGNLMIFVTITFGNNV
jgi:hypothetical protein